jgi:two-component system nitrogen regulation sensor histidine kinase GlnL
VAADVLKRVRPTPESSGAADDLEQLGARVAAGVFSKLELCGVVAMGHRRSGLIYTAVEQDALQILCNQLGVALENARLYTEVRNNQIYNDTLVDNLISGLVAVDGQGHITVFNREAQRITGLDPARVLGRAVAVLPPVLAQALNRTLASGESVRDQEAVLREPDAAGDDPEEGETPIRLGTSLFRDARDITMGAFLVFTDLTTLKKLEQQVRRSDRLASIGTLSAGMAHEIKNPLVTIKTFTELLPERYQDQDFRETFSALVGQEVERIDRIVNEVLHFARPARPDLRPTSLRELLAGSLRLLQEQMKQKGIRLETRYADDADTIRADTGLLSQAFVNFFLNALDAMGEQGTLTVATARDRPGWNLARDGKAPHEAYVRLTIQDTGSGIPQEMVDRIFDPFFTTKSHGTGLGLSVAHGIIQDHLGLIECASHPGQGTSFHIYLPLVGQEAPA